MSSGFSKVIMEAKINEAMTSKFLREIISLVK